MIKFSSDSPGMAAKLGAACNYTLVPLLLKLITEREDLLRMHAQILLIGYVTSLVCLHPPTLSRLLCVQPHARQRWYLRSTSQARCSGAVVATAAGVARYAKHNVDQGEGMCISVSCRDAIGMGSAS